MTSPFLWIFFLSLLFLHFFVTGWVVVNVAIQKFDGMTSQKGIELPWVLTEGYQASKPFELGYQTIKMYYGRVFRQDLLLNPDGARNTCLSCDFLRPKYLFCPSLKKFWYESWRNTLLWDVLIVWYPNSKHLLIWYPFVKMQGSQVLLIETPY
jgi:hypothetical protein